MRGKTIEKDLALRDFTINALAIPFEKWLKPQWKKSLIDTTRGFKDIQKKLLVPVSDKIIKDDPLRLLRAFRIAAELDYRLSPKTLQLVKKEKKRLKKSAPERIREEMLKIFSTSRAHNALQQMDKSGLLDVLLPEVRPLRKTAPQYYGRGGVLKHTLDGIQNLEDIIAARKSWFPRVHTKIAAYLNEVAGGFPRSAHLKWSTLLHDFGKPKTAKRIKGRLRFFEHDYVGAKMVVNMANRFRWSSDETRSHAAIVRHHMRPGNLAAQPHVSDKAIHRFFRDLGEDAVGLLLVGLADHLTYLTPREKKKRASAHERLTMRLINRYYRNREKILPPRLINGHDVMKAFGLPPSRFIGDMLTAVTDAQSEGKVKNKKDALKFLKSFLSKMPEKEPSNGMPKNRKS